MKRPKFPLKAEVVLLTDPDLLPRIITKYEISEGGIAYCLSSGSNVSWHFGFEITTKDSKPKIGLK